MNEQRDCHLGARLDEIGVHEHGPDFWENVAAAIGPKGELETSADAGAHRGRRILVRSGLVAAAAVVVLLVLGLTGVFTNGGSDQPLLGPPPATAREAIERSLSSLDEGRAVRGTLWQYGPSMTDEGELVLWWAYTFITTPDGSERHGSVPGQISRIEQFFRDAKETTVFDAQRRTSALLIDWGAKAAARYPQGPVYGKRYRWYEENNLPLTAPDQTTFDQAPFWQLRAYLRALLTEDDLRLSVSDVGGRTTWIVTAPVVLKSGGVGDGRLGKARISIDAKTRQPYALELFDQKGLAVSEMRIDAVVLDRVPPGTTFDLQRPALKDTYVDSWPQGSPDFRALPLEQAAQLTSGMPVRPSWVPAGFQLASALISGRGFVDTSEGRGRDVIVDLVYRRGFDAITVTVRIDPRLQGSTTYQSGNGSPAVRIDTSDPFLPTKMPGVRKAWRTQTHTVLLRSGALAGHAARIVIDPLQWPHLWVKQGVYVTTVSGDLSAVEMVRIAESIGTWEGQ
jgi:hypothetical protein